MEIKKLVIPLLENAYILYYFNKPNIFLKYNKAAMLYDMTALLLR